MREQNKKIFRWFTLLSFLLLVSSSVSSIQTTHNTHFYDQEKINTMPVDQNSYPTHPHLTEMLLQVNSTILQNHIQTLQNFGPHPTGSDIIEEVGEYIYNTLNQMGISVQYDLWSTRKYSGKNIIATQPNNSTNNTVIICAHYDTVPVSPGADDDSSGVAAVLHIAEIMSNYSFNATIKYIFFSGEEEGLLGSREYAKRASLNKENIIGVLALDKIGYAITTLEGNNILHHSNDASSWMVDLSTTIADVYQEYIGLEIIRQPEDPGSDHQAFVDYGFMGTDFVRYAINPFYHTSEDLLEHMNISYLTKVCKLALGTFVSLACLNPKISDDDLHIIMRGTRLSTLAQVFIRIENILYPEETANVTILIQMKHLFRNQFVQSIKKYYTIPCNWSVQKEIEAFWEFQVGGWRFTRGLFSLEVTITGRDDDLSLYKKQKTMGMILNPKKVIVLPKG